MKVTAIQPQPPAVSGGPIGTFFDLLPNAVEVTKLRVQFTIEKQLGGDPNTCSVVISNLNETSRSFFEQVPLHIRLEAGYDGEYRHLFAGDLRFGQSIRRGVNWDTEIQIGDGDRAYRHAKVNRSYKPGITAKQVLRDVARAMGLSVPDNITASKELETQFSSGMAIVGPARDELTRLLAPYGYGWSIQNGTLQILKDGDVSAGQARVISQETGMLDVPSFAPPEKPAKRTTTVSKGSNKVTTAKLLKSTVSRPTLNVRTLLYPEITPGGTIVVQSKRINGNFKVIRVQHTGDTHGEDWQTEISAKQI